VKTSIYICPATGSQLKIIDAHEIDNVIFSGCYQNSRGDNYPINDGIPDFTYPSLSESQKNQHDYYENNAETYDDIQGITFALQNEDESKVRKEMVANLGLHRNSKVLELTCGTGRDSVHIANFLDETGELYLQDLSGAMLRQCKKKLAGINVPVKYSIGNATHLSFPDNYFDAVYSFGGLNVFDDCKRSMQEMVRVTKPGGRIVVGDESMPPWLYNTEFGKTMLNANPLFNFHVPLDKIPAEARDVTVKWVIGGVYYLISFVVGVGEPVGNFDLEIPGKRGGTLRTRYAGQLEGVTEETKKLVLEAAEKDNVSVHKWLDKALRSIIAVTK
jgi:ubiquinone/menaquinone biosynthesis C-methylase UbiE